MEQTKKIEFFMLIKSYNLSQLSAKILEGKTFDVLQPVVSCRVHAIVSKLCRFFSCFFENPPISHLLYFENERE